MATTIKLKNSVTTTNAPSSLVQGEVAINITDKKVWVGNAATTPIQLLGDGGSVQFTTVDTTNLQVTNIKAKDGTASASIANSTGIFTHATATAFTAGTVSAPAITTTGDTNTGIFFPAADTIAFTEGGVESMRIDSSGNVGIGTSSPLAKLDVRSASAAITTGAANFAVYSTDSQAINLGGSLLLGGNADTQIAFGVIGGRKENSTSNNRDGYLQFGTFQNGVGVTERARISSVGTLMVNTTTETGASAAVKILANSSASNTALQVNTGTSGGAVFSNKTGNGFQIYGYTGAIGSESYNKVMENGGVGTSIAIGGASSVSGVGITFPATQSASSDANTLDDYEEGTWTPVLDRATTSPSITYAVREGKYTKIGNMVTCWISINNITVSSAGSGSNIITGLPFAIGNATYAGSGGFGYNDAFTNTVYGAVLNNNETRIFFRSGTRSSGNDNGGWTSGGYLGLTFSYFVN